MKERCLVCGEEHEVFTLNDFKVFPCPKVPEGVMGLFDMNAIQQSLLRIGYEEFRNEMVGNFERTSPR